MLSNAIPALIFFAEGKKGKAGQLKVLHAKWDAHNGAAKEGAKQKVGEGNPDAANTNPNDIEEKTHGAGAFASFDG